MTSVYQPDLAELILFDAVARCKSLSAASRELGVSQQAASARLRSLERRLGLVLVTRSHSGAALTQAGTELLGSVRGVLDASSRLGQVLAELQGGGGRSLEIGASQTIASHLLPGWLLRLRERQVSRGQGPAETVLRTGNSEDVMRLVREGAIDVGFIETPFIPQDLGTRVVSRDRLVAVVPAGHAWSDRSDVPLAELAESSLVVREAGSGTRVAYEEAVRVALGREPVKPVVVLSTEAAVKSAVAGGLGPAVLSELTVIDDVRLGRVRAVPISGADLSRPLTALWRGGERDLFGVARDLVEVSALA